MFSVKRLSKRNVSFKVLLIIFFLCLLATSLILSQKFRPLTHRDVTFAKAEDQIAYDKWSELIKTIGGQKAYSEFKADTKNKKMRDRHYQAHLFGEALYDNEGIKGIVVCDNEFDAGCYHSFLGIAINSEGLKVIPELSDQCSKLTRTEAKGCQHGIGHGILSFTGYDLSSLKSSTDVCRYLSVSDEYKESCLHGVFMEYNYQTMLLDRAKMRAFDENNPYFPCLSVDEKVQGACMNQLAQWWTDSFKTSFEEKARKIDILCNESKNPVQCYIGFGIKLIVQLDYKLDKAEAVCNLLISTQSQKMCLVGVKRNIPSM